MFLGMMFFGWLPFLLLFLFIVAIRGVLRALGIFRRHPTGRIDQRSNRTYMHTLDFGDLNPPQTLRPTLESRIFRLASRLGGRVTISDVVIESDLGVEDAETFMDRLVDGTHVRMEVTEEGTVVYEFPELMGRNE